VQAVWIALGGNAAFLVVLAFLGRKLIVHWLDKDFERSKERIASESAQQLARTEAALRLAGNTEVERLKSELAVIAAEHSILLSRLQDRRAEVIDELYGKLAIAIREITSFVNVMEMAGEPPKAEKGKRAADAYNAFIEYFDRKKVWLPADCCAKVEELRVKMLGPMIQFDVYRNVPDSAPEHVQKQKLDAWVGAFTAMTATTDAAVPAARAALEKAMRDLLQPKSALPYGK
jgi:hypothetical protein